MDARVYMFIRVWKRIMCRWSWDFTRLLMPKTLLCAIELAMAKCHKTVLLKKMVPGLISFGKLPLH